MIFGRRGGSGRHARGDARRSGPRHAAPDRGEGGLDHDGYDDYDGTDRREPEPAGGPYDVSDAPDNVTRLDLGSLLIPAIEGVEVRVQANQEGNVQQVVLVHGPSALQLGVFAAPRSEGIWAEVRTEIRKSLFNDGVAVEEVDGEYGVELRARVRTQDGLADIRFVGVDGPRWMVRGVFQGPAAVDQTKAGPLAVCLRELVVVRGQEAKPMREPLPLRLPKEVADQAAAQAGTADGAVGVGRADETGAPVNGGPVSGGPRTTPPPGGRGGGTPGRKPSPRPRRTA